MIGHYQIGQCHNPVFWFAEPHLFSEFAAHTGEDHEAPGERAEPELAPIPLTLGDVLSAGES